MSSLHPAKPARRAYIITNHAPGEIVSGYRNITANDDIIAVDKGLEWVDRLGLIPRLIIGDMDSVDSAILQKYSGVPCIKVFSQKNETDTEMAVAWCIKQACYGEIVICNDLQGRFDHALAIVQNLVMGYRKARIRIESRNQVVSLLQPEQVFIKRKGNLLSIIPITAKVRFSHSEGLQYPLAGLTLKRDKSRGISNVFTAQKAVIGMAEGQALAIITISD